MKKSNQKPNPLGNDTDLEKLRVHLEAIEESCEFCMDLSMLDGFLAGVAIAPEILMPSQWLPVVWDDDEGPEFKTPEEAQEAMGLIFGHYNRVSNGFNETPASVAPIFDMVETDGQEEVSPVAWCIGFMEAMELCNGLGSSPLRDPEAQELIKPILFFASERVDDTIGILRQQESTTEVIERLYVQYRDQIGQAVLALNEKWRRERIPGGIPGKLLQGQPRKAKVGRNDPCSCGSGKKYKKCCLGEG